MGFGIDRKFVGLFERDLGLPKDLSLVESKEI